MHRCIVRPVSRRRVRTRCVAEKELPWWRCARQTVLALLSTGVFGKARSR